MISDPPYALTSRYTYPQTVAEVLDPPVRFRDATVMAVRQFAMSRPWRGTVEERKAKFLRLHRRLCAIYGKTTRLRFGPLDGECSGGSCYSPHDDLIELSGKLSVTTYLHEFAHALGRGERGACRWSINLFRRCFPRSFGRCRSDGHMLRRAGDR